MFYVYLLQSKKTKETYTGYTADLAQRFKEHNQGRENSTKTALPWRLAYYEAFDKKQDAIDRENKLKHNGQAKRRLFERIKHSLE